MAQLLILIRTNKQVWQNPGNRGGYVAYLYYFSGLVLDPGSNTGRLTLVAAAVTNAAPTIHGLRKLNHVKCYDEGALVDIQILIC